MMETIIPSTDKKEELPSKLKRNPNFVNFIFSTGGSISCRCLPNWGTSDTAKLLQRPTVFSAFHSGSTQAEELKWDWLQAFGFFQADTTGSMRLGNSERWPQAPGEVTTASE